MPPQANPVEVEAKLLSMQSIIRKAAGQTICHYGGTWIAIPNGLRFPNVSGRKPQAGSVEIIYDRPVSEGAIKAETMSNGGWKEKLERLCLWRASFQGLNLTLTEDLAIDLGAANTRVYLPGKGVVINEPTVIALDARSGKVAAVGQEAKVLARRQPREIRVARPIKDGAVADCEAAGRMLSQFLRRVLTHRSLAGLSLVICVPSDITLLEQRAYAGAESL